MGKLLPKIDGARLLPDRQSAAEYITEIATMKKKQREKSFDAVLQSEIDKLKASGRGYLKTF